MRNPFSLEAFADWCEKRPVDCRYEFFDAQNCACAQYARSLGIAPYVPVVGANDGTFWERAEWLACGPETFGALAQRLRAAIADPSQ